jgi:hypothetical protein
MPATVKPPATQKTGTAVTSVACIGNNKNDSNIQVMESFDHCGIKLRILFQCKVPRIQQMNLAIRQVLAVSQRPINREENVILSPDNKRGRFVRTEVFMPLRIPLLVGPVIIEQ